jgi:hypothetical protein
MQKIYVKNVPAKNFVSKTFSGEDFLDGELSNAKNSAMRCISARKLNFAENFPVHFFANFSSCVRKISNSMRKNFLLILCGRHRKALALKISKYSGKGLFGEKFLKEKELSE